MSSFDSHAVGLTKSMDSEVGKLVLDMGLVTRSELDFAREQQKGGSNPNDRSLADYLVDHQFITVNQAKRIRRHLDERKSSQIPGFDLIRKVGKGAMATVYEARQLSLDRIVAVKVLPKRLSNNPEFVDRFYKEGRAAARLGHSNIMQAIDVGSTPDGYHYFVMEFIEGDTLYDLMQPPPQGRGRSFSEKEALDITIQIGEALKHAHHRGLIHRDVKPKNILLTQQGAAKLTDLGLAREMDDREAAESEAGKAYGTPYYISPEQIRGEVDIDYRADIYSLGATMYHLVTGQPPFEAETPSAVMHMHLKDPLIPPDHLNVALSAGISEIVEFAMAKDPKERYTEMDDMLEDLRAVQTGEAPLHARTAVDLDQLAKLEHGSRTIDIDPPLVTRQFAWDHPAVLGLFAAVIFSILVNVVMAVLLAT